MLPLIIDPANVRVALVGRGDLLARRLKLLQAAGVEPASVFDDGKALPTAEELQGISLLFVAGVPHDEAAPLVELARGLGILVNTEDDRALCDFHVPASVRRGDLLMTVSTGGGSPGLARSIRKHLENEFGNEWSSRLVELSAARQKWRDKGLDLKSVSKESDAYIDRKGWLK